MDERYLDKEELGGLQTRDADGLTRLVSRLLLLQGELAQAVSLDPVADGEGLDRLLCEGNCITTRLHPTVDRRQFAEAVRDIWAEIRKDSPDDAPDVDTSVLSTDGSFETLREQLLAVDSDLPPVTRMIGVLALIPWYMAFARQVTEAADLSVWQGGTCPVCGQPPLMARLRSEDGARVMECWLCRAEWVFPRLQCPNCCNTDQQQLRLFTIDDDDVHRVHVCDHCQHYLKVADTRDMEDHKLLALVDVGTMIHDAAAVQEGYLPFGRSPLREQPQS